MKKAKHLIIVALVAVFSCFQAQAGDIFRFGVKAGLNVDKMKFSDMQSTFSSDNGCGFTAGVMTEINIPIVGIGFDLSVMYTHMNSNVFNNGNQGDIAKNFIEIPLNVKYKFSLPVVSSFLKPMVYTGPTMALKLDKSILNNLQSKTAQWGWNVGIGLELINHLQVCGGYTFGINNVAKWVGANSETIKAKNNYWTVTAAWLF